MSSSMKLGVSVRLLGLMTFQVPKGLPSDTWHIRKAQVGFTSLSLCLQHGTSVSKMLGFALKLSCVFTNNSSRMTLGTLTLPHDGDPQFLSITSSNLQFPLQMRLHIHWCRASVLFHLQNKYHLENYYTLHSVAASTRYCLSLL